MKRVLTVCLVFGAVLRADEGNPHIDYPGFLKLTLDLQEVREARRVSEEVFLKMAKEEGTVILDTRSRDKFEKLHVEGAIHLNFSDFSAKDLERLIPDKSTRILIYCNNNFDNEPELFIGKAAPVALNVPTFINLHAYGYENVYELKPFLDIRKTRIRFAGSAALREGSR
ncbi:rhodanese-like domain-containing protein [Haloferula sp.]|uniref:rhodanese-like domain-containing protein n=1 Tax=Haloferula sp. TaxID=2497595 RepID=UPI003C78C196